MFQNIAATKNFPHSPPTKHQNERNTMTFKDFIKEKLSALEVSQNSFAASVGVHQSTFSRFLVSRKGLNSGELRNVAERLGISIDELSRAMKELPSEAEQTEKPTASQPDERDLAIERERLTLGWERLGMAREVERLRFETLKRALDFVSDAIAEHRICMAREEALAREGKPDAVEVARHATEAARERVLRAERAYEADAAAYAETRRAAFAVLENAEGTFGFPAVDMRPRKREDGNGHNGGGAAAAR